MVGVGQGGSVAMVWRDLLWRWKLLAGGEDEWWIWKAMRTQGDHTASNSKRDEEEMAAPTWPPPRLACPLSPPALWLIPWRRLRMRAARRRFMMQAAMVLKMTATLRKQIPPMTPASTGCGSSSGSCVRDGYTSIPATHRAPCQAGTAPLVSPRVTSTMGTQQSLSPRPTRAALPLGGPVPPAMGTRRGDALVREAESKADLWLFPQL